jgi:hypothetical protein
MTRPATANERDRLMAEWEDRGSLELGTVGWEDGGDHYDNQDGQPTLVKVTLFRGRNATTDDATKTTRAQGHRLLARVSQPMNNIPKDGTQVMVAIPAGFGLSPGAGMIIAAAGNAPPNQFEADRAKLDFGEDVDLFIKARSVTIGDYENRYVTVGPDYGIKAGDASGCGFVIKAGRWAAYVADSNGEAVGSFDMDADRVRLMQKSSGGDTVATVLEGGSWNSVANNAYLSSGACYLGALATSSTGVLYLLLGAPTPSTSIFVQP